jgi:hypothetical protein
MAVTITDRCHPPLVRIRHSALGDAARVLPSEVNGVRAVLAPEAGACCVRLGPDDADSDDRAPQDR